MTHKADIKQILDKFYFSQPQILYQHLFDSYNQFIEETIPYAIESHYFYENISDEHIYLHGLKCSNIRIKPSIFENNNELKFPSDARKNQLNYFGTIIADIYQFVEIIDLTTNEKTLKQIDEINKNIAVANVPIMIKSKYCSTNIKKDLHGECKYDPGGYFIVNGAEKVIMSIEKMVDNKVLIYGKKDSSYACGLLYTAQINSRKQDLTDNLQILTIKNKKDNAFNITTSSHLIDIPIFILMRALGIESDMQIISYITNNLNDSPMINLLRPSMLNSIDENNNLIKTKEEAINYLISRLKKNKRISNTNEELAIIQKKMLLNKIFKQDLLPHLNEDIPKKIIFISYMINQLLNVMLGRRDLSDRDSLQNKRIETPGILLGQLFRQYWRKMLNDIGKHFKKKNQSDITPINIINQIRPTIIEHGLKTALATGIWGINKTKKGVAQALQRVSWLYSISCFRRVISPTLEDATSKVTSIRHVDPRQVHFLCITETPEGPKVGVVKSLSMMATITLQNISQYNILTNILKFNNAMHSNQEIEFPIKHPFDISPLSMDSYFKIFLNGDLYAMCHLEYAHNIYIKLKLLRRQCIIDYMTSIILDIINKEIRIYYDGGRLIRPLLIVENNKLNFTDEVIKYIYNNKNIYLPSSWKLLLDKYNNLIEYEDVESISYILIAVNENKLKESVESSQSKVILNDIKINRYGDYRWLKYTHCEFAGWTLFGLISGNIPFSNHNAALRNTIHFAQAKQAIGLYLTSYKDRMDMSSQILYYPQIPIVQTETMKYNNILDLPFGENCIVAICSYTGYNQDDSIIVNQSSIDRGLFRADTFRKYHSEIKKNPSTSEDDLFIKPDSNKVIDMKHGNYNKLNEKGYIPEETIIEFEDIIIGKVSPIQPTNTNKTYKDNSEMYKSHVQGVIDRVHTNIYNSDRYEMYNVRVRMEREPIIGDKFTNFHGGKGTIGITLPQKDMPFTESGMVPDFILNPHAFPSRMSVGYLIECLAAKQGVLSGKFIDGTPFNDYDVSKLPEALIKLGYSPWGTEKMYCGLTGKQMNTEIFVGPSYMLRLKHMVMDRVHGRARGPNQALTRQPLEGRSRDGGLKIGEMEKDAILSHGMGQFLKEKLMENSDITKVYICDDCGMFAYKVIDKDYYKCKGCKNTSRISAVVIPYACKLLIQELMSINILLRIRTEKSIYADEM
uniref:DNA-directed RNA polymerase n=1 Tax=viral metagenome TaxID=1070528 RepID=A0A6C0H874_9ZZZZ